MCTKGIFLLVTTKCGHVRDIELDTYHCSWAFEKGTDCSYPPKLLIGAAAKDIFCNTCAQGMVYELEASDTTATDCGSEASSK